MIFNLTDKFSKYLQLSGVRRIILAIYLVIVFMFVVVLVLIVVLAPIEDAIKSMKSMNNN